jgi:hypothetical protein
MDQMELAIRLMQKYTSSIDHCDVSVAPSAVVVRDVSKLSR